jgi:membrane-bound serine protease (ClpP class)
MNTEAGKRYALAPDMSSPLALSLTLAALACALGPGESAPPEGGLTLVRIEGELDVGTQALVKRAIDGARERGDRLVLELDTPGGEIELMWQIANALLDASPPRENPEARGVSTVAWVHDRALSAGALLALACERVYMRSHATIGSALPVSIGPGGLMPSSEDPEVREKLSSALRAEFRGVAEKRGRSGLLAEAMVDPDVEVLEITLDGATRLVSAQELDDLRRSGAQPEVRTINDQVELLNSTGSEAVALGLADGLAESLPELASKLGLPGAAPTEVRRSSSEDLAAWLYRLSPLFLIASFVLFYLELKTPGFGLAGTCALVMVAVVLFGRYLVGLADIPHVLLIAGGAALVALELFLVPGTIWPAVVGCLAILCGLIWSFAGARIGFEYSLDRAILVEESFRVVGAGFLALLIVLGLSRLLPRTPLFGRMVLVGGAPAATVTASAQRNAPRPTRVGAAGRTTTPLMPFGKVVLDEDPERDRDARSEGPAIDVGTRVKVLEVQPSGRLVVSALEEPAPEGGARRA